jgi:tetratricopeptide (TPR) repeat protein
MSMKHQLLLLLSLLVANSLFAQKEDIFFYDGFADNKHNWNVSSDANFGAQIKDGSLFFESKKKNASWYKYNPTTPSIDATKDFTVEWSFKQIVGSEDWGTGLVCFLDDNGSNAFGLWILSNGQWTITKTGDPAFGWKSSPAVLPGNNVMNTASITKKGGTISFVINNQQVHQISYSPGLIKHVAFQIGSEKTIAVDYLKMAYLKSDNSQSLISADYTFEKFLDEGLMFYKRNDNDQAIISLTEAINSKPNEPYPYNLRGYAYHNKKEIDIAIRDYLEAIRLSPTYSNAYLNLGYAYLDKKEYDKSLTVFNKAISSDPKDVNNYSAKGSVFQRKKEYDSAITCYSEIIRLNPRNILGYRNRANVYIAKKDYERAISEYNQFLRIDSLNHSAHASRGFLNRVLKIYDAALLDYNNAIRLSPKSITYYSGRAYVYKLMGDTKNAITDFDEYVKLYNKAAAYPIRGNFYREIKKYDLAIADYNKAIELDPKYVYAYYARGGFYSISKQYDLALIDYNKAITLDPKNRLGFYGRAELQKEKGLYQAAISDFEKVFEINPDEIYSYASILSPLIKSGNFEKAQAYASKAKAKWSEMDESYFFYSHYINVVANFLNTKQYEQALEGLDKSIQEYTNSTVDKDQTTSEYIDLLSLKGFVLEKMDRNKEAKAVYEQCLVINDLQPDIRDALVLIQKKTTIIAGVDKSAPEIQLISPQPSRGLQIVSANQNTEVIGKAKDPSGIASVTINGKPVTKIEEDGLFVSSLNLKSGLNTINITATDKKGNVSTKSFQLTGNTVAKKEETDIIIPVVSSETAPQFHALLIAANDYVDPKIADLENPVKDATELKNILQANYTFAAKNIETLYNKSREEIMQALVVKSNAMSENDNLLIFYAGHGIAEKDKFGDVDGYWVPSSAKKGLNASYISADDINKALKRSSAKHILVVADACFSGAFTRSLSSDASIGVQKQYSVPSRKIMASGNLEPVPDNSKFVYYLKKNLKENKEKYLTAKKLFDSFYEAILNNSETSPQYAAIKNVGDEGGEFVFIKK